MSLENLLARGSEVNRHMAGVARALPPAAFDLGPRYLEPGAASARKPRNPLDGQFQPALLIESSVCQKSGVAAFRPLAGDGARATPHKIYCPRCRCALIHCTTPWAAIVRDDFRTTAPSRPPPAETASPHSAPSAGDVPTAPELRADSEPPDGFGIGRSRTARRRSPRPEAGQHQQRIRYQNYGECQSRDERQPAAPLPRATSMARTTVINPLGMTQKINSRLCAAIPRHAQRLE